jgi:hypothetical protein
MSTGKRRRKLARAARRAIDRGETPTYALDVDNRRVTEMPWLEFDGRREPEIMEAARRAIAADLQLRPEMVAVEPLTA